MSGFIDAVKSFVGGAVESASQPTPPPQTAQSALTGPPHLAPVAQLNEGVAANAVAQAGPVGTLYEKHHNLVERSRPPRTTSPTYSPILPAAALPFADYPAAPTPPVENSDEVDRFSLDGDFLDNDDDDDLDGEQMISNDILDEDALVRAMQEDKLREQRGPLPVTKRLFESSSEEESNDEDAEVDQLMDDDLLANQTHSRSPATNPNQGNATAGPSNQRAVAVPSTQRVVPGAPRYTVEMVRNNSKNNRHVIRLAPGVDDGRPSTWPQTLRKDQLVGGKLNWHREIQRGEPKDVGWREKIGDHLAKTLELPRNTDFWILDVFPPQYRFYEHLSGDAAKIRSDPYLFGYHRSRSPYEALPHFLFLCLPPGTKRCECKYCAKVKSQREVNSGLGIVSVGTPMAKAERSPSTSSTTAKKQKMNPAVDKVKPKVIPKSTKVLGPPSFDGIYAAQQRTKDLGETALFRVGEMVWMELSEPIESSTRGDEESITHWPAIVVERSYFNKGIKVTATAAALPGGRPQPQFEFAVAWAYDVSPLACSDTMKKQESQLTPYYGRSLPTITPDPGSTKGIDQVFRDGQERRAVLDSLVTVKQASITYALAIQTALTINLAFSLIERYTIRDTHIISLPQQTAEDSAAKSTTLKSNHYQCAWLGPELIWNGELVRMCLEDTEDTGLPAGLLPRSKGTDGRTFFLLISAICRVPGKSDVQGERAPGRAQVAGTLYELQDLAMVEANGSSGAGAIAPTPKPDYMPTPPPGYAFRLINPPGTNYTCVLDLVAGRYYPLPPHVTREDVNKALLKYADEMTVDEEVEMDKEAASMRWRCILAGLLPPVLCSGATQHVIDRQVTVLDAEKKARALMKEHYGLGEAAEE